jgi:Saxitoxin biosynthesis operon protein SxtJ
MIGEQAVTGCDGNWHESLHSEGAPPSSSDRSFGFVFAAVCAAVAVFAIGGGRHSALWWSIAASIFCVVALLAAPVLGPLNRAWRWLSLQLFRIVNPIIMGVVFFAVLTPIAIAMRCAGRDPLRLRFEPARPSYWLDRASPSERQTSMTDQF